MAETTGPELSREQRVNEVIADYLQALDAGQAPDRQELLTRYPDLAVELAAFFDDHDRVDQWSGLVESTGPERQSGGEVGIPATGATGPELATSEIATDLTNAGWDAQRYRILQPHAQGGLGMVSIAEDLELHRRVALKEIQPRHAHDPQSRVRFLREAEITGYLEHPGIVPIYSLTRYADGRPFYVMRFIQGESLAEAIQRLYRVDVYTTDPVELRFHREALYTNDPVEFNRTLRGLLGRFVAACNAVAYAHSRGVLHRDLKPANIMLGAYGETLVIDWGLAKVLDRAGNSEPERNAIPPSHTDTKESLTEPGMALGTPAYMSPEQAAGHLDRLGPASDIYSLGATLYTLLTGQSPIRGRNTAEILRKAQQGDWRPPREVCWQIPAALDAICCKAMALDPERRYDSALKLAADVEKWLANESVSAWREPWYEFLLRALRRHNARDLALCFGVCWGIVFVVAFGVAFASSFVIFAAFALQQFPLGGILAIVAICIMSLTVFRLRRDWNKGKDAKGSNTGGHLAIPGYTNGPGLLAKGAEFCEPVLQPLGLDRAGVNQVKGKAYGLLGWLYQELRQRRRAVAAYRKALAIQDRLASGFPDVPSYQTNLARTRRALALLDSDPDRQSEGDEVSRSEYSHSDGKQN